MKIENGKSYVDYSIDSIMIDESTELDYVLISMVYTDTADRGKGIARQLLTEAIDEIKTKFAGLEIKICALPKEDTVDIDRFVTFYESAVFSVDDEQDFAGVFMTLAN